MRTVIPQICAHRLAIFACLFGLGVMTRGALACDQDDFLAPNLRAALPHQFLPYGILMLEIQRAANRSTHHLLRGDEWVGTIVVKTSNRQQAVEFLDLNDRSFAELLYEQIDCADLGCWRVGLTSIWRPTFNNGPALRLLRGEDGLRVYVLQGRAVDQRRWLQEFQRDWRQIIDYYFQRRDGIGTALQNDLQRSQYAVLNDRQVRHYFSLLTFADGSPFVVTGTVPEQGVRLQIERLLHAAVESTLTLTIGVDARAQSIVAARRLSNAACFGIAESIE